MTRGEKSSDGFAITVGLGHGYEDAAFERLSSGKQWWRASCARCQALRIREKGRRTSIACRKRKPASPRGCRSSRLPNCTRRDRLNRSKRLGAVTQVRQLNDSCRLNLPFVVRPRVRRLYLGTSRSLAVEPEARACPDAGDRPPAASTGCERGLPTQSGPTTSPAYTPEVDIHHSWGLN